MRYSGLNVRVTPRRTFVPLALAVALCGPLPPASASASASASRRRAPTVDDPRQDVVAALHREGEVMFAAADYSGARNAWLDAYKRIERTPETWPYRATLLSLVVTAAIAEHNGNGRDDRMQEVIALIDVARSSPQLDPEVLAMLETEWERVQPYLPPEPEPEPEPVPVAAPEPPPPVVVTPQSDPPPEDAPRGEPPVPSRTGRPAIWIGAGTATLLGGVAAAVVGTRFRPRAESLVRSTNDSTTMSPGADFIEEEARKGRGWIIGGSVAAALGAGALVTGIVLLARRRR